MPRYKHEYICIYVCIYILIRVYLEMLIEVQETPSGESKQNFISKTKSLVSKLNNLKLEKKIYSY